MCCLTCLCSSFFQSKNFSLYFYCFVVNFAFGQILACFVERVFTYLADRYKTAQARSVTSTYSSTKSLFKLRRKCERRPLPRASRPELAKIDGQPNLRIPHNPEWCSFSGSQNASGLMLGGERGQGGLVGINDLGPPIATAWATGNLGEAHPVAHPDAVHACDK